MPRYRTINNDLEINVDGKRIRASADGVFEVAAGSRAEEVLRAGGVVDADALTERNPRAVMYGRGSRPLRIAEVGDSITRNTAVSAPIDYPGVERGTYNLIVPSTIPSTFLLAYAFDGSSALADTATITWDGSRYMSATIAGDTAGALVDVTGGGWFWLPSGSGLKGIVVRLRWSARSGTPTTEAATNTGNRVRSSLSLAQWCSPALMRLGFAHADVRNFGISGDTAQDLLARIGQITAFAPDVALVLVGTNSYSLTATPDDIQTIVSTLATAGALVIVATVTPRGDTTTAQQGRQMAALANRVLRLPQRGIRCLTFDAFSPLAGTAASGSSAVIGTYFQADLLHPNLLGCVQGLAPDLSALLKTVLPTRRPALSSASNAYNAVDNPYGSVMGSVSVFAGTAGVFGTGPTPTGTLATGWTDQAISGAFTTVAYTAPGDASPIPRTDGPAGNWQRIVAAGAVGSSSRVIFATVNGLVPGMRTRLHIAIRLSNTTLLNALQPYLNFTCASNGTAYLQALSGVGSSAMVAGGTLTDSGVLYLTSDWMDVPKEMTSTTLYILFGCSNGGGLTLDVQDAVPEILS